jgi:hypothetical protein
MWFQFVQGDDDGPEPSPGKLEFEEQANDLAAKLKKRLESLTVRQQRRIIEEIADWGVYRNVRPAGDPEYPDSEL